MGSNPTGGAKNNNMEITPRYSKHLAAIIVAVSIIMSILFSPPSPKNKYHISSSNVSINVDDYNISEGCIHYTAYGKMNVICGSFEVSENY